MTCGQPLLRSREVDLDIVSRNITSTSEMGCIRNKTTIDEQSRLELDIIRMLGVRLGGLTDGWDRPVME